MDASKLQREKPEDVIAIDWRQIALNGGPPCFFIEGPQYCGRAERWQGHGNAAFHDYISLAEYIATVRLEAAREAREEAWKKAIKVVKAVHRNTMGSVSDWQILGPLESAMKRELEAAAKEGGGDG